MQGATIKVTTSVFSEVLQRSPFFQKSFATAILKKYCSNVQMVTIPGATTFCQVHTETDFFF